MNWEDVSTYLNSDAPQYDKTTAAADLLKAGAVTAFAAGLDEAGILATGGSLVLDYLAERRYCDVDPNTTLYRNRFVVRQYHDLWKQVIVRGESDQSGRTPP